VTLGTVTAENDPSVLAALYSAITCPLAKTLALNSRQGSQEPRPSPLPYLLREKPHQKPRRQCLTNLKEEEEHNEKVITKKRPKNGQKQKKKEEILNEL
jgi:hypothetical protein